MKRRRFLRDAAAGVATLAGTGLAGLSRVRQNETQAPEVNMTPQASGEAKIGRPVTVVSIGFGFDAPWNEVVRRVDEEGARRPDLIFLPETCRGQNDTGSEEPLHGQTVTAMAELAAKHGTYIAVPIDRRDGNRRLNTVALLDRRGQIACVYEKVFPYWSEFDLLPAVSPGDEVQVYKADFGRMGMAVCFDVNFPEVWKRLADMGAEMVIWPSAYSAGASLQAHAINHHYPIVSCTQLADCMVYDITGERIYYARSEGINVSRVTLDLDRGIYHENFNLDKRDRLLHDHPEEVVQEKWMRDEQWFVLKAARPGVSARGLAREYGLEELRHYLDRSRMAIDRRRGWEFAGQVAEAGKSVG
jgi:predicted amidohydrolase